MKYISKKLIVTVIIFSLSALLLTISSFAWYRSQRVLPIVLENGEFDVVLKVDFDGLEVGLNSPYYDNQKKIIIIDGGDSSAPNYIGKLNISVEVTSSIASRFRLRLQDEWQLYRHYFQSNTTVSSVIYHERTPEGPIDNPFIVDSGFDYLSDNNGFIYYNDVLLPNVAYEFKIIDRGTRYNVRETDNYYEECVVHLDFYFDIVQANRFSERWQISETFFN